MVRTALPSKGCDSCRRAKSRCSQDSPACTRCQKRGVPCTYARANRVFRSMNTWASTAVTARVCKANGQQKTENTLIKLATRPRRPVAIPKDPNLDWYNESISVFMSRFTSPTDMQGLVPGFFQSLPRQFLLSRSPHLRAACTACAWAYMSNITSIPRLNGAAFNAYQLAVASVRTCLNDLREHPPGELLLSIMLLVVFESISGSRPTVGAFEIHLAGQSALLEGSAVLDQGSGCSTIFLILEKAVEDSKEVVLGEEILESTVKSSWLTAYAAETAMKIARARARAKNLFDAQSCQSLEAQVDLFTETVSLDRSIELPLASNLPGWPIAPDRSLKDTESVATSPAVLQVWNYIALNRIYLLRTLIQLSESCFPEENHWAETFQQQIQYSIESIRATSCSIMPEVASPKASTPPRLPNGTDLLKSIHTLQRLASLPETPPSTRLWLLRTFSHLATTGNIRQGQLLAQHYQHIVPSTS